MRETEGEPGGELLLKVEGGQQKQPPALVWRRKWGLGGGGGGLGLFLCGCACLYVVCEWGGC